eukprot:m.200124 g.200124  ORF g.200124 m.200124 type:complete len:59 (+) comp32761_c0_seq1:314-490(+)
MYTLFCKKKKKDSYTYVFVCVRKRMLCRMLSWQHIPTITIRFGFNLSIVEDVSSIHRL